MFTQAALAEKFEIPEATLVHWRYKGIGPAYLKIGRHVRYRESDVNKWLEAQRVEQKAS